MPLISAEYKEMNRRMHEEMPGYGQRGSAWASYVTKALEDEGHASVLDWGCGKGTLKQALPDAPIFEFDPAIPGKDGTPDPADLVLCTDVLEHIEPQHINAVLRELKRLTKRKLMFNICTVPAQKTLPDGRNAHILLKGPLWWRAKLAEHFQVATWGVTTSGCYGECFPMEDKRAIKLAGGKRTRRLMTREWQAMIEEMRQHSAKYFDEFNRVKSIRMWEGIDDEPADMQIVCNYLEHVEDIDAALADVISHCRKAIMVTIIPDAIRTEAMWRSALDRRIRLDRWDVVQGGAIICVGAPKIEVQGVIAKGAVAEDERWEQLMLAIKRVTKRIQPAPQHGRRAIIACYGPSLKESIPSLKQHIAEFPDATVVSVSGAHDMLIEHGIVPKYHVECDPRPHKTDNIAAPHPDVQYLVGSVCHPSFFDKLQGADVALWHVSSTDHSPKLVDGLGEHVNTIISGGGSVGLRSVPLLYAMGYRDFSIYAMDCSFAVPDSVTEGIEGISLPLGSPEWEVEARKIVEAGGSVDQWAGKHAGKKKDLALAMVANRIFVTSPILMTYATSFWDMVKQSTDCSIRLYGDGLLQHQAKYYAAEFEKMAQQAA
jgi:hypothetical protein